MAKELRKIHRHPLTKASDIKKVRKVLREMKEEEKARMKRAS